MSFLIKMIKSCTVENLQSSYEINKTTKDIEKDTIFKAIDILPDNKYLIVPMGQCNNCNLLDCECEYPNIDLFLIPYENVEFIDNEYNM